MDEFLRIIYANFAEEQQLLDDKHFKMFNEEILNQLKKYLSDDLMKSMEETVTDTFCSTAEFYFIRGMKLAIAIMEKEYIPSA